VLSAVRVSQGVLISSVKTSSVNALPIARSRRVEQLGEGFAVSAYQHRQTVVSVTGCGYTPDRFERTDRDLAVFDQLCDVG
jgi:hypothetical protein